MSKARTKLWKRLVPWGIAALIVGAIALAFVPKPLAVEVAEVTRGPMRVTVDEDGRTRIRERYTVSAPINGRLSRIALDPGDAVRAGDTAIAAIEPVDPTLLDPRERAQAEARVRAAEAALRRAEPVLAAATAELEFAQSQLKLRQQAGAMNATSQQELDVAMHRANTAMAEMRAAEFARDIAKFELETAQAALITTQPNGASGARFEVKSPISGVVLRVLQESEGVVMPGTPLVEVGDPRDLEVEVDVLSRDGARISPGAPVLLEHWGGDQPLEAVVRLVEPAAFTKISALGVEEQRVNVIIDFPEGKPPPPNLGDAFRVEARIAVWQEQDVVQVPLGALFRQGERWAVYTLENGRAALKPVEIGHRAETSAQVLSGIDPGEAVIVHPGDKVRDGARVRAH
jgi:HlyD family secretion protein